MKLKLLFSFHPETRVRHFDVGDAVVEQIERNATVSNPKWGAAERAQCTADETARLLGRLVETLHTAGKLTDDEVAGMLDSFTPVVPMEPIGK